MKTRERILVTSLRLFNALGEPHVTTLDICNEMDISPGNLYYHYKGKDEIIAELFARFEADMQELQGSVFEQEVTVLEVWMYMQLSFEAIARFQFIYRDLTDLMSRYPLLQRRFKRLLKAQQATIKNMCAALQLNEALQTSEADLQRIAEHIVMTMSFWLNFEQIQWRKRCLSWRTSRNVRIKSLIFWRHSCRRMTVQPCARLVKNIYKKTALTLRRGAAVTKL